jgi:hypothetical protein
MGFQDAALARAKCRSAGLFVPAGLPFLRHHKSFRLGMKQPARTPVRSGVGEQNGSGHKFSTRFREALVGGMTVARQQ